MKSTDRTRRNRLIEKIGQEKYDFLMLINPHGNGMTIPEACDEMGIHHSTGYAWLNEIDQILPGTKKAVQEQQARNSLANTLNHDIKQAENRIGLGLNYVPGIKSLNDELNDNINRKF